MNKRNIWKYEETKEMLQIMLDNNYAGSFSSKHRQNMEIFRKIENKMIESGYPYKNYMQIGVRWKNLKNLYMKAKRSNSKNEQQLFPFYEEMDNLLRQFYSHVSGDENTTAEGDGDETTELVENKTPAAPERKHPRKSVLDNTIATSKQELSDEFYRSQKRLIDYEFSLYVRKEEEMMDRIQETTRNMIEENMNKFFTHLKDVLAGPSVQQVEVIETYE
uniref:Myb/SANT-like DNA-binding domain-containing protein n=1 Tax=Anopheles epiroticus TaxID=199890 RepID=A0A182PIH6_9DIPT